MILFITFFFVFLSFVSSQNTFPLALDEDTAEAMVDFLLHEDVVDTIAGWCPAVIDELGEAVVNFASDFVRGDMIDTLLEDLVNMMKTQLDGLVVMGETLIIDLNTTVYVDGIEMVTDMINDAYETLDLQYLIDSTLNESGSFVKDYFSPIIGGGYALAAKWETILGDLSTYGVDWLTDFVSTEVQTLLNDELGLNVTEDYFDPSFWVTEGGSFLNEILDDLYEELETVLYDELMVGLLGENRTEDFFDVYYWINDVLLGTLEEAIDTLGEELDVALETVREALEGLCCDIFG